MHLNVDELIVTCYGQALHRHVLLPRDLLDKHYINSTSQPQDSIIVIVQTQIDASRSTLDMSHTL